MGKGTWGIRQKIATTRGFHHSYAYQGCCGDYWQPPLYILNLLKSSLSTMAKASFMPPMRLPTTRSSFSSIIKSEENSPFTLFSPSTSIRLSKHRSINDKYVSRYEVGWDKIREARWKAMKEKGWFEQYDSYPFSDSPPWHDETCPLQLEWNEQGREG